MNSKFSKKALFAVALFSIAVAFSSCNRGYGCPYELKSVVKIVSPIVK